MLNEVSSTQNFALFFVLFCFVCLFVCLFFHNGGLDGAKIFVQLILSW